MYDLPVKANSVISLGELVNLESGYVDGAATNDAALVGIALEAANNTGGADGAISIKAIVDPDAVYAIDDANAAPGRRDPGHRHGRDGDRGVGQRRPDRGRPVERHRAHAGADRVGVSTT